MNNHTISQQYCDSNNGGVISGYGFIKIHHLSQCDDSITVEDMDGDVEKVGVSS